jgi:hypothetical protein
MCPLDIAARRVVILSRQLPSRRPQASTERGMGDVEIV